MFKRFYIGFIISLFCMGAFAQNKPAYFMPYEMPTHSSVKFNTFLMNPALPLLGEQEQNAGLHYRKPYSGYKDDNFLLMGGSYGIKWDAYNTANIFAYKRNAAIMSNMGAVLNYGHFLEFSEDMGLRLGLNVIPIYSGVDASRVRLLFNGDEELLGDKVMGLAAQPGLDFNFKEFHIGFTAENAVDYSFTHSQGMTSFESKAFTAHLMYRSKIDGDGIFEKGLWHIMARYTKDGSKYYASGNALLDLPKLGFAYGGYTQKYGAFAGLGFNISNMLSVGFEYEMGLGAAIPNLGSTYGIHLNFQFGGDRQKGSTLDRSRKARSLSASRSKAEGRLQNQTTGIAKPKPAPKPKPVEQPKQVEQPKKEQEPKPAPVKEPEVIHNVEAKVRVDTTTGSAIPPGHYVVIGVYQNPKIAFKFMQEMRKKYDVSSFVHPVKKFTYVYLNGYGLGEEEAANLYRKNIYNKDFPSGIWILKAGR